MAGKEPERGPTARAVADNVRELRTGLRFNYTELSEVLEDVAGWSINAVGIRRIESGERRVTPDDLVALALALGVSPISLMMPDLGKLKATDLVEVTGQDEKVVAQRLWDWLRADRPLTDRTDDVTGYLEFTSEAVPQWIRLRRKELLADELRRREKRFYEENAGSADGDD